MFGYVAGLQAASRRSDVGCLCVASAYGESNRMVQSALQSCDRIKVIVSAVSGPRHSIFSEAVQVVMVSVKL